ncbi:shikimate dehydrogenase [Helicobacter bilis]|uniref:Shikimate dehydrogenase (NADP(+)) n=1 Tax=Helicobacter bilis TaxID=37372 RepID=A0A4U8UBT8_9HELI|nr:shikimate dehydrogenase [Helicobacter bilis]TLE11977.1 shikimate dehydrogenase [Helicobacter bilis]
MQNTQQLKLLAVIGNPIKHSLSPLMHNYALQKLGLNSFYTRFCLPQDIDSSDLADFILSSDLAGVNVTLPFKETCFRALDSIQGIANEICAVNTIVRKDNKLIGYNTDAEGFYYAIKSHNPKHVLLLGAGGSARSIATILSKNHIKLTIANRSTEKLAYFSQFGEALSFADLGGKTECYDIIVNATSASVKGVLPMQEEILIPLLQQSKLAYDLMYQANDTPFCALAKRYTQALDGKAMLVYQGALALMYFHDMEIQDMQFMYIAKLMAEALKVSL